jgi:hypothetical protein
MPHFSDDPGADEDPEFLLRLRRMLRGRKPAPRRLPHLEERFGVPAPRDPARGRQDAVLVGPDQSSVPRRGPLR